MIGVFHMINNVNNRCTAGVFQANPMYVDSMHTSDVGALGSTHTGADVPSQGHATGVGVLTDPSNHDAGSNSATATSAQGLVTKEMVAEGAEALHTAVEMKNATVDV